MTGKLKRCDAVASESMHCAHGGAPVAGGIWHSFAVVANNVQSNSNWYSN